MKIDKNRFLLLTTTIAASAAALVVASACTTTTTNATPDAGPTQVEDSATPVVKPDATVACYADKGSGPTCEGGATDDAGDGGAPRCTEDCFRYGQIFKSEVAVAINSCLNGTTNSCENAGPPCVDQVLDNACDDATAATVCASLLKCDSDAGEDAGDDAGVDAGGTDGGLSPQKSCERVVRAMAADGRTALQGCVEEGGGACLGSQSEAEALVARCIDELK